MGEEGGMCLRTRLETAAYNSNQYHRWELTHIAASVAFLTLRKISIEQCDRLDQILR